MSRVRGALVITVVLAATSAVQAATTPAFACTCAELTDQEHYTNADVVFTGEAIDKYQEAQDPTVYALFRVEDAQKGVTVDHEEVSSVDPGVCGWDFQVGERYQVFAHRHEGALSTDVCSGTRSLSSQDAHIPPTPEPTQEQDPPVPTDSEAGPPPRGSSPGPQEPATSAARELGAEDSGPGWLEWPFAGAIGAVWLLAALAIAMVIRRARLGRPES